ncbi:uncharacterized protein [Anabrus simplex]|uniref:uncharacterized protein n=1 Tax=Anabrus simplex TaxID=316456 RepID=UPI0034DD6B7E
MLMDESVYRPTDGTGLLADTSKANVSSGELQHDVADQLKQWFSKQSASVHDIPVPKVDKVAYYAVEKITELPVSLSHSPQEIKNTRMLEGNDELNKTNREKFELLVTENQLQDALNGLLKSVIRQKNSIHNLTTGQEDYEHNQRNMVGSVSALKETLAGIVGDTNYQGSVHSQTDPPRNSFDGNEKIRISIIPDAREKLSEQRSGLTLEIVGKK